MQDNLLKCYKYERFLLLFISQQSCVEDRGGSRNSGNEVHMYKGVGVRFADFISFFLNIPWK